MNNLYIRDGVTSVEQLKPYKLYGKDDKIRYCFYQMVGIINTKLSFDQRKCGKYFHPGTGDFYDWCEMKQYLKKDPAGKERGSSQIWFSEYRNEIKAGKWKETPDCDFWHYQLDAIFRNEVGNGQCNSIYVGTSEGINLKKLKRQPNDWQLFLLNEWNKMFHHLADKNGWIKVEVWW